MALRKAKALCEEAEQKVRNVKVWSRDFDRLADPLLKKLDSVRHFLEHVVPRGVAQLETTQRILESYSEMAPPVSAPPPPAEPQNQA